MRCRECGRTFLTGDFIIYGHDGYRCSNRRNCFERMKAMPNIKITAEVDGKQVPLNTISTETFEAIKALQKPKEIPVPVPVARVGNYIDSLDLRRLFLKITDSVRDRVTNSDIDMIAISLMDGDIQNSWKKGEDLKDFDSYYENVKPL